MTRLFTIVCRARDLSARLEQLAQRIELLQRTQR